MIKIGNKEFETSEDLNDWMSWALEDFLLGMYDNDLYTRPLEEDDSVPDDFAGRIYTQKGQLLIDRWMKRMQTVFDHYVDDNNFYPHTGMYREF